MQTEINFVYQVHGNMCTKYMEIMYTKYMEICVPSKRKYYE